MRRVLALLALGVASSSCTTWHECSAHDRQHFVEASLEPSRIPPHAKALAHRVVAAGEGERVEGVAMYTHASQYKPAEGVAIDLAREEIVRITDVAGPTSVLWVAETDIDVIIGVMLESTPCTAYPSPKPPTSPVDIVIALTAKPVRLVGHNSGPACVMNGQP
jgi:hypothetical protein